MTDATPLQRRLLALGEPIAVDGKFGPGTMAAALRRLPDAVPGKYPDAAKFLASLVNLNAPALTDADFAKAASDLGVGVNIIRAVRKVEAPRGPFDDDGRPTILYERHVFARNTDPKGEFSRSHPSVSGPAYGSGGYGPFSQQYARLTLAYKLDPGAAIEACSWGAFQVLGENWQALGYASPLAMAQSFTVSEAAHLDSFVRFVRANNLIDELRECRAGDPASCIPFVAIYNGPAFRTYNYHEKLAAAAL